MSISNMTELSLDFLQDIYYAEKKAYKSYPKMVKAASSEELKRAFTEHREQTQTQIERLEHVFEQFGKKPRGKTCAAMDGMIEEAEEAISEGEKGPVLDAALIACAQAVEHYEITRYGTMIAWAKAQGKNEIVDLLQQTLDEEKETDGKLNELANSNVNQAAAAEAGEDEEADEASEDDDSLEKEEVGEAPKRAAGGRRK